jgi:hypothetical protein
VLFQILFPVFDPIAPSRDSSSISINGDGSRGRGSSSLCAIEAVLALAPGPAMTAESVRIGRNQEPDPDVPRAVLITRITSLLIRVSVSRSARPGRETREAETGWAWRATTGWRTRASPRSEGSRTSSRASRCSRARGWRACCSFSAAASRTPQTFWLG